MTNLEDVLKPLREKIAALEKEIKSLRGIVFLSMKKKKKND